MIEEQAKRILSAFIAAARAEGYGRMTSIMANGNCGIELNLKQAYDAGHELPDGGKLSVHVEHSPEMIVWLMQELIGGTQ